MTIEKTKTYEEVKKRFEERFSRSEKARKYEEARKRFESRLKKGVQI